MKKIIFSYHNYCINRCFLEKPDYDYLKLLFRQLFEKEKFENDGIYDWMILDQKESEKTQN